MLRKVLNSKESIDILKDIVESILEIKIKTIELNPYLYKKAKYLPSEENFGIADVRITKDDNEELFLNEAADLMYHYIVLLIAKGYGLEDVVRVLEGRHGKDKS